MATLNLDYRENPLPDIVKGIPEGRGYRMSLRFQGLVDLAVEDILNQWIRVPNDEHWYVKQFFNDDQARSGGSSNGWRAMVMYASFPLQQSPVTVPGTKNNAPWTEQTHFQTWSLIWNRWAPGGVGYIYWIEHYPSLPAGEGTVIVRCTDPVWSEARWGPGTEVLIQSKYAEIATATPQPFSLEMNVVRYRTEDADLRNLEMLDGREKVLATDVHMVQHYPALGE